MAFRRWAKSIRIAGLVSGFMAVSTIMAQEVPKLPTLPVVPPSTPTLPTTPPTIPAPPTLPTPPTAPVTPPAAPVIPVTPPSLPTNPATPEKPVAPTTPATPKTPTPTPPPAAPITPANKPTPLIPPADSEPTPVTAPKPTAAKISFSKSEDGSSSLPKALATAREAHSKLRDYAGFIVRQERVQGKLLAEQTCEIRYRVNPMSVSLKVVAPKGVAGQDTVYNPTRWSKVKHMAGGLDGIRLGYQSLAMDDPKVLVATRHTMNQVGLLAVLDRVERTLATEKRMNNPVQVLMSDFTFVNKPCTRYEIFCDKPHPARYAQRLVVYIDKETNLPVRFEAYENGRQSSGEGDLLEMCSFVNLKYNIGLGANSFER